MQGALSIPVPVSQSIGLRPPVRPALPVEVLSYLSVDEVEQFDRAQFECYVQHPYSDSVG